MPLPYNERIQEAVPVVGVLAPQSMAAAATGTIGPFLLTQMKRARFTINVASLAASSVITLQVQAATASAATAFVNVTNASASLSASGFAVVEVKAETLGQASTPQGPWVQGKVSVAAASALCAGQVDVGPTDYSPASDCYAASASTLVAVPAATAAV